MKKNKLRFIIGTMLAGALLFTGCGSASMNADKGVYNLYDSAPSGSTSWNSSDSWSYSDDYYEDYGDTWEYDDSWDYVAKGESGSYTDGTEGLTITDGQAATASDQTRKLITTVNMDAETEDFVGLVNRVKNQVAALGGYLEEYDTGKHYAYYSYDDNMQLSYANMTIRIPADQLDALLTLVEENANILTRSQSTVDVTLDYVDVQSRKEALQVEYDDLLRLLEKAENLADIITLQDRMSTVRYQIENLESQLRSYDNRVTYSTVYLYVNEVIHYTQITTPEQTTGDKIGSGLKENLYHIGQFFVNLFIGIVVYSPYIGIALLVVLLIIVIVKLSVRNYRKKKGIQ